MLAETANLLLHLRGNNEKAMAKNYKKQPTLSNLNLRQLNLKFHYAVITAIQLFLPGCQSLPETVISEGEWPVYGGDPGGMKYSKLDQIDRDNVDQLELAWTWKTGEEPLLGPRQPKRGEDVWPGMFEATPLMIDGMLILSTPLNRVVALNPDTGAELWRYDPRAYEWGRTDTHRGVATWTDGRERRIFINTRWRLIAIDARTGQPISTFGQGGEIDLTRNLIWEVHSRLHYRNTSPPAVYKDLVIVGSAMYDRGTVYRRSPPGDVQAFDVRTGKRAWSFHTIPQEGEFGTETWEDESWSYTGNANVWGPFTVDAERGLVYLPVSAPNNDYYGGHRKGDNLFSQSIVCLDATTGERVWHFQTIHHGLWDWDLSSPPNLVTIEVNGKNIDAVVMLGKTGFAYVFDRVSGEPVWPIEERPVPQSDVPGERTSPTQPFPTRPPPFSKQGFDQDDVVDFTPEIRAMALELIRDYRMGPLFTPPSLDGTIFRPGGGGGANYGGAAFDPETGVLYVRSVNMPGFLKLEKNKPGEREADYEMFISDMAMEHALDGLPISKPPYALMTAIDLNEGTHVWQVPLGDSPWIREHPLLEGLELPPLGIAISVGLSGPLATKGGLVFISGGSSSLYAMDMLNGETLWEFDLGGGGYGNPMTYQTRSGRQYVVIATGEDSEAELKAFALPPR